MAPSDQEGIADPREQREGLASGGGNGNGVTWKGNLIMKPLTAVKLERSLWNAMPVVFGLRSVVLRLHPPSLKAKR